jgi:hypothetical protein
MDGRGRDALLSGEGSVNVACEHDNEISGFVKCGEFLDCLINH